MAKKGFRPTTGAEAFARWNSAYQTIHVPTKQACAGRVGMGKLQCVLDSMIRLRGRGQMRGPTAPAMPY